MTAPDLAPTIESLSETVLLLRFGDRIDAVVNHHVHALASLIGADGLPGVIDVVPTYAALAIHFDIGAWSHDADPLDAARRLGAALRELAARSPAQSEAAGRVIVVPVCYDAEFGEDLDDVATALSIGRDELVRRHTAPDYRVAMLGFAPGFPYLLGLDPSLRVPRRAQPRLRVPAGGVAIGGLQTGIYPSSLPGGWRLIGRTPWALFDIARTPPNRLAAGDRVRFQAIDRTRFDALREHPR